MVHPEFTQGTMGMRWEYTSESMSVRVRDEYTHFLTISVPWWKKKTPGEPGGNPHGQTENISNVIRTVIQAQGQTLEL